MTDQHWTVYRQKQCAVCKRTINEGVMAWYTPDKRWIHDECYGKSPADAQEGPDLEEMQAMIRHIADQVNSLYCRFFPPEPPKVV